MKKAKKPEPAQPAPRPPSNWPGWAAAAALGLALLWAYGPAMNGPFLFDDSTLGFSMPDNKASFVEWVRGVRPLLQVTYWLNYQASGDATGPYHFVNLLIHCLSGGMLWLALRKLLERAGLEPERRNLFAGAAVAIFLLHPAQTEAVAYLAGRSEVLATLFVLAAYTVFLYRKQPALTWARTAAIMGLFLCALASKESSVALPALLLLTDAWWNEGSAWKAIRGNWRIYALCAAGAALGVYYFLPSILHAPTAGFGMQGLTWYQYFFTQCRALFVYPGIFVAPVNLTLDWDFAISKTLLDRGAVVGLAALLALAALAIRYRRRFPLVGYGFFVYLALMAPTSSFMPIRDPIAERRLYFSMIGLLIVAIGAASRLPFNRRAIAAGAAAIALFAAFATHARAALWGDAVALWEDTAAKSPGKPRAHFQLAFAYYTQGEFSRAVQEFSKTAALQPPAYDVLVDWALAYDQLNQPEQALAKLREAAALEATPHVYSQMGMIYAKRQQWAQAMDALARAQQIDPGYAPAHMYRGAVLLAQGKPAEAAPELRTALVLDPTLQQARNNLKLAERQLAAGR